MRAYRYLNRLAITGLIASAAALTLSLAPAAASAASFNSSVTIRIAPSGDAFTGNVNSPKAACKNRRVTLQRKRPGQANFINVGTDTSAGNGSWTVRTSPVVGVQYRAAIDAKSIKGNDRCKAAKSSTTRVQDSKVTIKPDARGFGGSVQASAACTPSRAVQLQRKTVYQESFGNIGSDTTDRSGDWSVATAVIAGAQYRAKVSARQANTATSCVSDVSGVVIG